MQWCRIPIAVLIRYKIAMFETSKPLTSDSTELGVAAKGLVDLAKSQALQIEKLKHQSAGHQPHRFGSKLESADQLNLQFHLEERDLVHHWFENNGQVKPPPRELRCWKKPLIQSQSKS